MLLSDERRVVSPLSLAAGVFVAGIAAGFAVPSAAGAWMWAAVAAAWLALVAFGWRLPCPRALVLFVAGAILAMRTEDSLAAVKARACERSPEGGAPVWRLVVEGQSSRRPAKNPRLEWIGFWSHVGPQPVKVVIGVERGAPAPSPGEVWECAGWLTFPKDGSGRYRVRTLWCGEKGMVRRVEPAGARSWRRWAADASAAVARRMSLGLSWCPEIAALNRAMMLGRRAEVSAERRKSFVVSGTVHIFAISGLHVMMIARLLEVLLKALGLPVRLRAFAVVVAVAAYTMVTGARPSAVRAALMAGFYYSAVIFGRRPDSLAAWSLAVFVVYGLYPERLFDAGCALSFTVMLGIVLWLKWVRALNLGNGWTGDDSEKKPEEEEVSDFRSVMMWVRERLREMVSGYHVSLAAWVAGTPVAARIFGSFTWGGLIANLIAVKLAELTVFFAFLGILAGCLSNVLAVFFNLLAAACTGSLLALAALVAQLPEVSFSVRPWSFLECAAWYGFFVLLLIIAERFLSRRSSLAGEWWK